MGRFPNRRNSAAHRRFWPTAGSVALSDWNRRVPGRSRALGVSIATAVQTLQLSDSLVYTPGGVSEAFALPAMAIANRRLVLSSFDWETWPRPARVYWRPKSPGFSRSQPLRLQDSRIGGPSGTRFETTVRLESPDVRKIVATASAFTHKLPTERPSVVNCLHIE